MLPLPKPCHLIIRSHETVLIEKKSRFITNVLYVDIEEDAQKFIQSIRKKYHDAKHHVYAYRILGEQLIEKFSDDGEPAQTAGQPMLDVLRRKHLYQLCVVCTRYFGGVLLGTGGLVRAYTDALIEHIEQGEVVNQTHFFSAAMSCGYSDFGKIQHKVAQLEDISIKKVTYTDQVVFNLIGPIESQAVLDEIKEIHYQDIWINSVEKIIGYRLNGEIITD